MDRYSAETSRRFIQTVSACYEWAIRTERTKQNPFRPYVGTIRKTAHNRRYAFTAQDRDLIIQAFKDKDPWYWGFVAFSFRTGARQEEIRGLEWQHIGRDEIRFEQAIASGTNRAAGTKTGHHRTFPLDDRLREILKVQEGRHSRWIFPSPEGSHLDSQNFLNRHWNPIVQPLATKKLIERYLPPYHCRHTFITLALRAGVDVADVATLAGNNPTTIWQHYAQASTRIVLPDF